MALLVTTIPNTFGFLLSVLDFVNGVRELRGLGPLPGLLGRVRDASPQPSDPQSLLLGVPAGGSETRQRSHRRAHRLRRCRGTGGGGDC
jgi:hypothetical protein